jgi:hypothetical protein
MKHEAGMGEKKVQVLENLKKRSHLQNIKMYGRILKCILKKLCRTDWLRIVTTAGLL